MMNTDFKEIEFKDDKVVICHKLELEHSRVCKCGNPKCKYVPSILESYHIAQKLGWNEILFESKEEIITRMKRYKILLNNEHYFTLKVLSDKYKDLVQRLNSFGIYHLDMAFRNIGIDENDNLQVIDLSSLCKKGTEFRNWHFEFLMEFLALQGKKFDHMKDTEYLREILGKDKRNW